MVATKIFNSYMNEKNAFVLYPYLAIMVFNITTSQRIVDNISSYSNNHIKICLEPNWGGEFVKISYGIPNYANVKHFLTLHNYFTALLEKWWYTKPSASMTLPTFIWSIASSH